MIHGIHIMNINNSKIRILWKHNLIWAVALLFFASCYYEEVVPLAVEIGDDPISYELDVQPFFEAKCNACHAGSVPPDLSVEVSYNELISDNWINTEDPASSPLYLSIIEGGSMEIYATPAERAMLLAWIEQEASNN